MDCPLKYDPTHLDLRCNALPEHQMASITSGCVFFSPPGRGATFEIKLPREDYVRLEQRFDPPTWTVFQQDGPNHLGLWYNMTPEHQMAVITSGSSRGSGRRRWPSSGRRPRASAESSPSSFGSEC